MATYYANVTRVIDGDTIEVLHGTDTIRIRLYQINLIRSFLRSG